MLSVDSQRVQGWVTNNRVLQAIAQQLHSSQAQARKGQLAAEWARPDPEAALHEPSTPLRGYQILEIAIDEGSPGAGQALRTISWPPDVTPVSVLHNRRLRDPGPDLVLRPGDRITLLARPPQDQPPAPARDPAHGRR